jgi:hypothetical protein
MVKYGKAGVQREGPKQRRRIATTNYKGCRVRIIKEVY